MILLRVHMPSLTFALILTRITLLEALRTRLAWLAVAFAILSIGAAQFLNQIALTEAHEIQIAFVATGLRVGAVFLAVAFTITSTIRDSNDKIIEFLLAQPVSRSAYFYGKYLGLALVNASLTLIFSLVMIPLAPSYSGLATWAISLAMELHLVSAIALLCALSIPHVVTAFASTAGFYLLARSVDTIRLIASASPNPDPGTADVMIRHIVELVAWLMPALDGVTRTEWLISHAPGWPSIGLLIAQFLLYIVLTGAATLFDLHRKSF